MSNSCDPMDYSPLGSSVLTFSRRILEWFAISVLVNNNEASLVAQMVKNACSVGDSNLIPVSGRCPGEGNGNPLQYSCLKNSMDRGAWQAIIHGVTKSWTWLRDIIKINMSKLTSKCSDSKREQNWAACS